MNMDTPAKRLLACLLLGVMGFLGNGFKLELFHNVDFLSGSFFVMLAVLRIGGNYAVAAGFIAAACTYFLWNHPWAVIILTSEAVFVSRLYTRRKGNLIIYDLIFWAVIGIPMTYCFYHVLMGMPMQITLLVMLKQSINGVFNTLTAVLAHILLNQVNKTTRERISYSQLVFVKMVSLVVLPAVLFLIIGIRASTNQERQALVSEVAHTSETARSSLANWIKEHHNNIQTLAALVGDPEKTPLETMQHYVETFKAATPAYRKIGVLNKDAVTVAYSPLEEHGLSTLGISFADRPYLSIMKETKQPYIPDISMGKLGKPSPIVLLLAPIVVAGEYKGYCSGVVNISQIATLLFNLSASPETNITVIDGQGMVIASTIAGLKLKDPFLRPYFSGGVLNTAKVIHWMPPPAPGQSAMQRWKESLLVKAAPIDAGTRWQVVVETSYFPVLDKVSRYSVSGMALFGVLIIMAVALSGFLSKSFVSTIVKLQEATRAFPKRLDGNIPISWPDSGIAELAELSDNLKEMAAKLVDDIAERKQAEEQRQALEGLLHQAQKVEAIGTLAGGIAHDFNNILAALMGYTELTMTMVPEDDPIHQNLTQIMNAGLRARDLVKQILGFSRMNNGEEPKKTRVGAAMKDALRFLRASLPTTIEIRQDIANTDDVALIDPTQIHQVVTNLCTNASHAMEEEGGILEVKLAAVDFDSSATPGFEGIKPGPYLRLSVSDTGHGMEPAMVERIFNPYFTTKEPGKGSGLGLAVVHGIVKRHNGFIRVFSEPMKGTTFDIYLPRVNESAEEQREEEMRALPGGNERILLVDDEKALADVGQQILQGLGYAVTAITSSAEAFGLFRKDPQGFDLVISDFTMPEMTGATLAERMAAIRPDIPIILYTGFTDRMTPENARKKGVRDFLQKPLNRRELALAVRRALNTKTKQGT